MAPSGKGKVDPKVSTQGTGESSGTTNNGVDLTSDSEEDVGAGAGIERVTCSVEGCTWFQPITTLVPASILSISISKLLPFLLSKHMGRSSNRNRPETCLTNHG